jgi:hypothetical protein
MLIFFGVPVWTGLFPMFLYIMWEETSESVEGLTEVFRLGEREELDGLGR